MAGILGRSRFRLNLFLLLLSLLRFAFRCGVLGAWRASCLTILALRAFLSLILELVYPLEHSLLLLLIQFLLEVFNRIVVHLRQQEVGSGGRLQAQNRGARRRLRWRRPVLEHGLNLVRACKSTRTHRCVVGDCGHFASLDLGLPLFLEGVVIIVEEFIANARSAEQILLLVDGDLMGHLLQVRVDYCDLLVAVPAVLARLGLRAEACAAHGHV